ncbi:MAG: hypothetical protein RI897_1754 [Verrucomicrobiota bacterium]|jgi:hypothetical protein
MGMLGVGVEIGKPGEGRLFVEVDRRGTEW